MYQIFSFMILLVIAGFIFYICKSNLDIGSKLLVSVVGAVGIGLVGAIFGGLVMVYPILALPPVLFFTIVGGFLIWAAITTRKDKPKEEKPDPNVTVESILETLAGIKKGQEIRFGPYDWLVLTVRGNEAFIYTKDAVMEAAFHHDRQARGSLWANCTLRSFLNDRFLRKTFRPAEQSLILEKQIPNTSTTGYGKGLEQHTELPTTDRLFPLSVAEIKEYVPKDKWACGTLSGEICQYHLRDTCGRDSYNVEYDGSERPVIVSSSACFDAGIRIGAWIRIR